MNNNEATLRPRYRWAVLFASLFAFVAYAFTFQTGPPLIQSIIAEFNISDAQAALVMSIVLIPGIILSIPTGLLVRKYGVRRIGIVALICVVLSALATVLAGSFALLLVGRLILGIGGTLIITASPAAIAQWFRREELGKAMGIFAINMPFATIIAFPTASALMLAYGWRFPFHISLGVSAVAAVFYFAVVKTGPYVKREKPASMREAFRNREIWKVGIVWLFFNAAALSFTTWAPTLLGKYKGMPEIQSGFLASLFMWSAIFCVPVYGYLSDETGRRKLFAQIGFLLMSLSFVALAFTSDLALVASILALGITAAMIPPIVSTLPAEILGPSLAGIGFGTNNTCANVGASLAQPFVGFLLDLPEPYMLSLFVMAAFAAIGAVAAYTLKTK